MAVFLEPPSRYFRKLCVAVCSDLICVWCTLGFPDSPASKESACNAGGTGLIPGLGRSAGEGVGYRLQYSWASLVVQLVKNPPAVLETWVWSLGREDALEKGKATHSSILAWRIPWTVQSMRSQRVIVPCPVFNILLHLFLFLYFKTYFGLWFRYIYFWIWGARWR